MKAVLVAVVLASFAFAGCTETQGKDDATAQAPIDGGLPLVDGLPAEPTFDFAAGVPTPVWNVGDWWSLHAEYTSGETYDATLVVYGDDGSHYLLTADSRDLILRAAFTHYPTISPVVKSSFNQFIHGQEVGFLKFPMMNGTWTATFRDFQASYSTAFATLATPNGDVPGFATVVRNAADGNARIRYGWSPVTKWFTNFTFDFDGVEPVDVTFTLRDWGSNYTGAVPVLEIVDGVHRLFPTFGVAAPTAPPAGAPPAPPPVQDSFTIGEGSTLLMGMFAGAGGAGKFDFNVGPLSNPSAGYAMEWRPQGAGNHFGWDVHENVPAGEWGVLGYGAAQGSAFMFGEAYEVKPGEVTLPLG